MLRDSSPSCPSKVRLLRHTTFSLSRFSALASLTAVLFSLVPGLATAMLFAHTVFFEPTLLSSPRHVAGFKLSRLLWCDVLFRPVTLSLRYTCPPFPPFR